ncbi:MAG: efflux RND transporter periplasmic adaptor subunit [Bacteroidales bacterium]|nr:efflux RND transporter periplasmic adaptor subunit [Bacteroidales bacterium]
MKKKVLIIGAVVVVAVITTLVLKPFAKKDTAVTFDTVKVTKGNISNTVTATGTIDAITTINVGTQVSGIIEHIYVDFNDNVKQGQLLAKLDETSLVEQLKQSQASLDQAQAQLNFQESTWKRQKALFDKNLIAQTDYDQAVYNYENSKASLSNAKSALSRAKVNLAYATITSPIDGVVLNRAIEEGQTVAASFSTPTLFTIVNDLTQMEVQTSVDEADIGKVKEGQRVEFTVDAYPDMQFKGSVAQVRLQPVTTNNVVTYVVILNAPNPDKKLMPGMTASAVIYVDEKENTLVLSGKALRFTPDASYLEKMKSKIKLGIYPGMKSETAVDSITPVAAAGNMKPDQNFVPGAMPAGNANTSTSKVVWVKENNGGIHPAPINLGIENGNSVEILSGLKAGDEIVISMTGGTSKTSAAKQNAGPRGPFPF